MPLKFLENIFNDLLLAKLNHLLTCIIAIRFGNSCKQQTQEIVYLGNGTDSRARIFIGSFLFNGNNRAEASDFIYIRSLHIADELSCIGTKAFHITALTFVENSIKCKRRFTAAAYTGKYN